jgi:hypothetical protein
MMKQRLFLFFILLLGWGTAATMAVPTSDTTVQYATYLGTAGQDNEAIALELNPAQQLVLALNVGEAGFLRLIAPSTGQTVAEISTGGKIHDMDVNRATGEVAVVGAFGLKVYTADLASEQVGRAQPLSAGNKRVGMASDGRIVTSAGNQVSVWSNAGVLVSSTTITSRTVLDVAISAEQGQVYVGGFWQASGNYQSPFLYAYAPHDLENRVWRSYDYWKSLVDAAKPYALTADSRLYRIAIGRDNQLYILGEAHGGVTVFKTNGYRFDGMQGSDLAYISAVEIDNWNKMHNTNSAKKAFVARVNYQTGLVERGQFILPRWDNNGTAGAGSSTRNFTISEGSLAVDEAGNIYVGGSVGTYMKGRYEGTLRLNGQPLGAQPANDREMTIYIVNAEMTERLTWAAFTKDGGDGIVTGIAASNGVVAFSGRSTQGTLFTTADATRPTPFNPSETSLEDAYLAILNAPADLTAVQLALPAVGFTTRLVQVRGAAVPLQAHLPLVYRLFVDGVLVDEQTVNSPHYQFGLALPAVGSYEVRLEGVDGQGNMGEMSAVVAIVVPQEQFLPLVVR